MAKVPEYGAQRVAVSPGSVGSVIQQRNAPAASFGAGGERNAGAVGQAVTRVGSAFEAIAQQARKVRAEENLLEFQRARNEVLMNPETGYYNKKGRDAYEARDATYEELERLRRERADQISDPIAREMFTNATSALLLQDEQRTMEFAARNFQAWEQAVSQQRVEMSFSDAARDWHDPEQLAVDFELGKQSIIDMNQGMGAEFIANEIDQYAGKFYRGVVESAINSSVQEGQMLLDQFDGYLDANDEFALKEKLRIKQENQTAQLNASMAINKAQIIVNDVHMLPDARNVVIEEVNKIEDPVLRDMTMRQALQNLDQRLRAQSEERAAYYDQAVGLLAQGWTTTALIASDPEGWNKLSGEMQAKLLAGQTTVVTDFAKFAEVMLLPQEELAKVNPADYVEVFAPADRQRLLSAVEAARTSSPQAQTGRTRAAQVSDTAEQLFGENVTLEQKNSFYAMLTAEEAFREKEKGSELSTTEFTAMLNDLTLKVAVETPYWFDDDEMSLEDVPAEYVLELTEYLHENGIPVTAQNLVSAYQQAKQ